ncbi:MAG: glycosyltransferase family 4 protein, partial [Anaerolineae bacterium]|nr:glycosyltransferase family 4 protein [Anaerolineae bacterium]
MRLAVNAWFWDSPTTGSGQYVQRLIEHLSALEQKPEVILVGLGLRRRVGSTGLRSHAHKIWFEQVWFPRACARLGVDVAHVPYWGPPLTSPVPTVVTIHDLIPLLLREYRGGWPVRLYTALVSLAARRAALILTDSQASRQDIVTHLKLPPERVRVIYLGVGAQYHPTPAPEDEAIRARYGLPERYMLYLGGFDVRKNVAMLLRAYRLAGPVIGEDCPLAIVGQLPTRDTPLTPDPRRLAREEGVDGRFVRFVDFADEAAKPALYRGAVAFVFPSRYEGFGLPPLEALACGTPVICST